MRRPFLLCSLLFAFIAILFHFSCRKLDEHSRVLKLKQGVLNYIVFVECGNKRYALVNENPLQTQRFFNNKGKAFLHKQLYLQSLGNINAYTNWQLATEQELVALIGSSLISGIGVYSSTNPDKTLYQKLNF